MSEESGFQVADGAAEAYERNHLVFMGPLIEALLDRADPQPGSHVLDLACGTGFATRAAARRVGSRGGVTGADLNPGMLEVARRACADIEPPIRWEVASAQDLPFADGAFDTVVCQQGIEFFPDLPGAVLEMARVTTAGGTVAATSWTPLSDSPYFQAQHDGLTAILGEEGTASFRHAFRLTDHELRTAWEQADLRDVTVERHLATVTLPPLADFVSAQVAATPWGPGFAAAPQAARDAMVAQVTEALAPHTEAGVTTVTFGTWIVAGTR